MKKQSGVTLVSLVIYVAVMILVLGMMSTIITDFYENTTNLGWDVQQIVEFNKFNTYFLKEIKTTNNSVKFVREDKMYIEFESGNSFLKHNDAIYFNNSIKICDGVESLTFNVTKLDGQYENVIKVNLTIGSYTKSISYKIENIY